MPRPAAGRSAAGDPALRAPLTLDDFRCAALGQVIAEHRSDRRITRETFADLVGVREDQLERLEAGRLDGVSVVAAWTMADLLGVDLAELLHETRRRVQQLAAERNGTETPLRRLAS